MVPCYAGFLGSSPSAYPTDSANLQIKGNPQLLHPLHKKLPLLVTLLSGRLSQTVALLQTGSTELLSHTWREGTKLQYDTTVRRWGAYCSTWKIDTFTPPIAAVVNFLTSLFEMGLGYGAVASVRSALGNFVTVPGFPQLAEHLLVQKLLKGIANVRPPKPRYTRIWGTSLLITYLASLHNGDLDLQHMCWKTSALLTVLFGQRVSTIHKFKLSNLQLTDTNYKTSTSCLP